MSKTFLNEVECYTILNRYGISCPKYVYLESLEHINSIPFSDGQKVVYKAVIDDLWHKSDLGLISFDTYSLQKTDVIYNQFYNLNPDKDKCKGLLVCEQVGYVQAELPCELLLSIKEDSSCGPVVTLGFGGIHTEMWGNELKEGVLNFPVALMTVDLAMSELVQHLLGKILLGKVRGGKAISNPDAIRGMLTDVWHLAGALQKENLSFIEINPLVIHKDGHFVALDGVGEKSAPKKAVRNVPVNIEWGRAMFEPQTILIAGVSSKKKAFGNIILNNLTASDILHENIIVLKPGNERFEDFHTIHSLAELATPVDIMILAVPADQAVALIEEIFRANLVKIICLVAGGIGDGADNSGLKDKLVQIIKNNKDPKRPRIIGPNSLGMILSPQKINTLFIPKEKLDVTFNPQGNVALVAQSGAFFITRLSRNSLLPLRYGLCIGNQIDLSAGDIIDVLEDSPVSVIGLYLEGPPAGNALALAKAIKKNSTTKKIIIYRAGRSSQGMKAAAGHTGALASDYSIEKKLLSEAGAVICDTFNDFENRLKWYSAYPDFEMTEQGISVISNAGYESVASADGLAHRLCKMSSKTAEMLEDVLKQHKLSGIVSPANPLDITPMASDDAYFECCKVLLQAEETQLLIIGIVPLTVMLETDDMEKMLHHAVRIRELQRQSAKPIAIVVDAGDKYKNLRKAFSENNLPVVTSVQDVIELIV